MISHSTVKSGVVIAPTEANGSEATPFPYSL